MLAGIDGKRLESSMYASEEKLGDAAGFVTGLEAKKERKKHPRGRNDIDPACEKSENLERDLLTKHTWVGGWRCTHVLIGSRIVRHYM